MVDRHRKKQYSDYPKKPHQFSAPQKSGSAHPAKSQLNLITNNFKIKSKNHGVIYTYRVDFVEGQGVVGSSSGSGVSQTKGSQGEDQLSQQFSKVSLGIGSSQGLETFQKFKIMHHHKDQLRKIFMQYVFVGNNLFSNELIDQQVSMQTTKPFFNKFYTIVFERVSEFLLDDLNSMRMEEHPMALSFVNSIIKNCLRNSKLTQIGRNPRFFMPSQAKSFYDKVETWPGFFTSSWIFQRGLYLIIDNISKFLSVDNCLTIIKQRQERLDEYQVGREFEGSIVMANYGQKRTYKVHAIRFDMSPESYFFDQGDEAKRVSMLDYFLRAYDTKISVRKQPLFEIKQRRQSIFLPPELCILVGIPQQIRENKRQMAEIRQSLFQQPADRIASICDLNKMIAESKEVKEWDLQISLQPDEISAKILKKPSIVIQNSGQQSSQVLDDPRILNTIVSQPINFEKWVIFCLEKDIENAKYIQDKFYSLSEEHKLKIFVDYGTIYTLHNRSSIDDFKEAIHSYFKEFIEPSSPQKKGQKPVATAPSKFQFALVIIPDCLKQEHFYSALKNKINSDAPIISQFVTSKTINRDQNKIFLNILRQINAKLGGDLWRMNFGPEISKKTMLVGIDVCHKGKQSIIGFCATYDQYLCKYYTQASPQGQKGQEIISSNILQEYFSRSFQAYREFNGGAMPDHIFIYRDGVGDSMRQQVIDYELEQLKKIVTDEYGYTAEDKDERPNITLIIVNKRVRQRFFEKEGRHIVNPPQGTYVDQGFVEQSEAVDGKFDFFLIPHSVTQGAVKPTHFYVAENSSLISKQALLDFTYALCYNYYNWPDSIKVPAPCMLADRIAIYRSEIGNIPSKIDIHKLQFYL